MIAYLDGTVLVKGEKSCVVLTSGGVGYEVHVPVAALAALPEGGRTALHVHTVVREDALELFGFPTRPELEVFRALISIDKLGPKKALAILSVFTPERLQEVAVREDAAALATAPGIGPKTAREILWKLKDRLKGLAAGSPASGGAAAAARPSAFQDALAALKNLGYSEEETRPLLKKAFEAEPDLDASGAIRAALKDMAARRA